MKVNLPRLRDPFGLSTEAQNGLLRREDKALALGEEQSIQRSGLIVTQT
jgi:hypothetical protein